MRAGILLLASLSGAAAGGYDLGGGDAICWLSQQTLATDNPNGTLPDRVCSSRAWSVAPTSGTST